MNSLRGWVTESCRDTVAFDSGATTDRLKIAGSRSLMDADPPMYENSELDQKYHGPEMFQSVGHNRSNLSQLRIPEKRLRMKAKARDDAGIIEAPIRLLTTAHYRAMRP